MYGIQERRHQSLTSMAKNSLSRKENLQIPKLRHNKTYIFIFNLLNLWHTLFCHDRRLNVKKVYKLNVSVTLEVFFGLEKEAASLYGGNRKGTYPRLNSIMKFCPPPRLSQLTPLTTKAFFAQPRLIQSRVNIKNFGWKEDVIVTYFKVP